MKDTYVVFKKEGGARIEKDKKLAESLSKDFVVIKNPDLSKVQKVSPSYWKYVNKEIVEMSEEEKASVRSTRTISPVETLFKRVASTEKKVIASLCLNVAAISAIIYILIKVGF